MELPDFLEADLDGEIRVRGHRIRLIDVAARFEEGHSAEAIVLDHYPTLSLPLVYKAIGRSCLCPPAIRPSSAGQRTTDASSSPGIRARCRAICRPL
jgi:hypothetical protein